MTSDQSNTQQIESNKNSSSLSEQKKVSSFIGDIQTAPAYMIDNNHITHGYRINFDNPKKILKSLFMLHNESVNIWSHFLPAILIIILIISFALMIDAEKFSYSYKEHKTELEKGIDHYYHTLDNLTLMSEYDSFKNKSSIEIQELKQTVINNYALFVIKFNENSESLKKLLEYEIEGIKHTFREKIQISLKQFQKSKEKFENVLAPMLLTEIQSFNISFINEAKKSLQRFKNEIDSESYRIIELNHDNPNPHNISRWPLFVFMASAVICLLCSTTFHLFYPMSSKANQLMSRLDFAGISLLIAGSCVPPYYYGMYCQFAVATIYIVSNCLTALACFFLCFLQWFHDHHHLKGVLFGIYGLTAVIPVTHMLINEWVYDNYGDPFNFSSSVIYYILLATSYLGGLYIYLKQCPERGNPGKYNYCGHSHQLWHACTLLGVIFTYIGNLQVFEMRKICVCPA